MKKEGVFITVPMAHIDIAAMRAITQILLSEGELEEAFDAWSSWCHVHGFDPFDAWKAEDQEHIRPEGFVPDADFLKKRFHVDCLRSNEL